MSCSKRVALERQVQTDGVDLFACLQSGLQQFLNACASAGFELPLSVELRDADGDLVRLFEVEKNKRIALGRSDAPDWLHIFPMTAVATDTRGRIAVLNLDARGTEALAPDVKVQIVN